MLAYRLGFAAVGDLLAQLGEYGADARLAEFRRRAQRVLQFLAGHEALDGAAEEAPVAQLARQERAARGAE